MRTKPHGGLTVLDSPTATDFEPLVGAAFAGQTSRGEVSLELLNITKLREAPAQAAAAVRRKPFALLFRARTADYMPQGLFSLTHDRFGQRDVFLVPVGRDPDGLLLEAVFN